MVFLIFIFSLFLPLGFSSSLRADDAVKKAPVSEQERARILHQMQGFAGSFQGMPNLPKMNDVIVLPEPEEASKK